jgi:hypothetical protein
VSAQLIESLARHLALGSLLDAIRERFGGYNLVEHYTQGEFHHDVIIKLPDQAAPCVYLVIATNCNGGVKELLAFAELPSANALWHWRCPEVPEFSGVLPALLGRSTTMHWFDPHELLADDARSEIRPEHRERQPGGGWQMKPAACRTTTKPTQP